MSDAFWMLLIGLACYVGFGFAMLYLALCSERRIEILAAQLQPRQPGRRRSGVVIRWPYNDDYEIVEDEA